MTSRECVRSKPGREIAVPCLSRRGGLGRRRDDFDTKWSTSAPGTTRASRNSHRTPSGRAIPEDSGFCRKRAVEPHDLAAAVPPTKPRRPSNMAGDDHGRDHSCHADGFSAKASPALRNEGRWLASRDGWSSCPNRPAINGTDFRDATGNIEFGQLRTRSNIRMPVRDQ